MYPPLRYTAAMLSNSATRIGLSFIVVTLLTGTAARSAHAVRTLPVKGQVTSGVGWRLDPFGSGRTVYHHGVDISAPVGTPVHPTQQGYVLFAGPLRGYGLTVAVAHGDGYLTFYGHNSEITVSPGQWVDTDAVIALSGNSGRSTGPHVHYEVRRLTGSDRERQEEFIRETMERLADGAGGGQGDEEG